MNFVKTFIITLLIYLGLNTVFTLVAVFTVAGFPTTDIMLIITMIFAPIFTFPGEAWSTSGILPLLTTTDISVDLMVFLGLILPPLIAIIVASFLGDSNKTVFGAWLTTALLSSVVYAILLGIGQLSSSYLAIDWFGKVVLYGELGTILVIFISGIANGLFYGCVAFIITKAGL
ncbi:MAG: hypothetical protein KGD67_05245 [Candidatus Lokiarchaeota archaeon]|nr:hypothetical protein [Candidatus Lokiarchaeota archaeon]